MVATMPWALHPLTDPKHAATARISRHGREGASRRTALDYFGRVLAERTGLEPATPGVTGRYSNQLNYRSFLMPITLVGADGIEPPTFAV